MIVTHDNEKLLAEIEGDIFEFGENHKVAAWIRIVSGRHIITNYDFISEEDPIDPSKECGADEHIEILKLRTVREFLIRQSGLGHMTE